MIRRLLLIALSVIPGTGPILLGRRFGSLLMFFGLNAWNLALLGFNLLISDPPQLWGWIGLSAGTMASLGSVIWTTVLTSPARNQRIRARADRALRTAAMLILRDKEGDARKAVESGLQVDPDDGDLRFMRWYLAFAGSGPRLAYPYYRQWRRADLARKWSWEIRREEELRGRK